MSRASVNLAARVLARIPPLKSLSLAIPFMPMKTRKALLTLTRVRTMYDPSSRAYLRLYKDLKHPFPDPTDPCRRETCLSTLLSTAGDYLASNFYSGLISMLVRNLPWRDKCEVHELLEEAVRTEMSAAKETYHPVKLNWGSVLSPSKSTRHSTSLIPSLEPDPYIHDEIYSSIMSAGAKISRRTQFPYYNSKTMGRRARNCLQQLAEQLHEDLPPTTHSLELLYHKYGLKVDAPTEVRTAFKFNDLRPRVYYARGPDVYYASRYIQSIFNDLVDSLQVTNRYTRYMANSLRIPQGHKLFIYDYSAFTSTLHELYNFTSNLADTLRPFSTTVIDTRVGPINMSLRELLIEYNETCNNHPSFDIGNVFQDGQWHEQDVHHNTGMLGIPGNISSSTLLHGIHLMCLLMSMECKCVGDDAIGHTHPDSFQPVLDMLSNIGVISLPKVEHWDEDSFEQVHDQRWHYTKRPIDRVDNRVSMDPAMVIWPALGNIHEVFGDDLHTVIYGDTEYEKFKRVARALHSFVLQFKTSESIGEEEKEIANTFIEEVIRTTGLGEYERESYKTHRPCPVFPRYVEDGLNVDDWIDRIWYTSVNLPRLKSIAVSPDDFGLGVEMEINSSRALKLAVDLGYAVAEPVVDSFFVFSDADRVRSFLSKDPITEPHVVRCSLSDDIPMWLYSMIEQTACAPDPLHFVYEDDSDWDEEDDRVDTPF